MSRADEPAHLTLMSHYASAAAAAGDDHRRDALADLGVDPRLLAIDPSGCGCTECLTGEYRPLGEATEAEVRALYDGLLADNADVTWSIDQTSSWSGSGFDVYLNGHTFHLDSIDLPPPVERYTLTLSHENVTRVLDGATTLD